MYIKSITIDGFKSYGQRITISQFDPFFNAITGLNGSGKSNILDAICFVLGISNLSQVRASSLTELIYKNGQAGITKASVSVTFDNNEKAQCPVGYEQYEEITVTRQIVIGGQNKYLINGSVATNSRVKDLFQSVQLNVNNPHFLIMQGRITKVLNMKPLEILSMIEEAAGTKMYETKKLATEKTIAQKDAKLREIDLILDEDINPTLTKLKDERQAYLEYQNIGRELQHLSKLVAAHNFVTAEDNYEKTNVELEEAIEQTQVLQTACRDLETEIKELQKKIETLNSERSGESEGRLAELETALKNKDKFIAKISSNLKSLRENLKAEQKKNTNLREQQNEDQSAASKKEDTLRAFHEGLEKLRAASEKDAGAVTAAEHHYQAVSSGLSSNSDGEEATFADQLMVAKTEIARSETETKQAEMTLKHSRSELKAKESELKVTEKQYKEDEATLEPLKKAVEKIETEMKASGYQEGRAEMLTEKRKVLQRHANELNDRHESLVARAPHSNFVYDNPVPNFDRRKVKGMISDLFDLRDATMATALEVTAGGKLFNVVVDNEETGAMILKRGNLRRRHTIVPLNKIRGNPITQDVLRQAENLVGKENVCTALSLVDYDSSVQKAMEFAFGGVLVCRTIDQANKVAFHKHILKRTVTVDGDSFDPAGTLTGGSRRQGPSTLAMIAEMKQTRQELNDKRAELKQVETELTSITDASKRFADLKQQLDLKKIELDMLNKRVKQSTHYQRLEEVNGLRQTIVDHESTLKRCQEAQDKESAKVKELELKIKDSKGVRERELKAAEKNVATCKKNAEKSNRLLKDEEQAEELIRLEFEDLRKGLANYDKQMKQIEMAISEYEAQLVEQEQQMASAKTEADEARGAVSQQKNLLKAQDQEISGLQKAEIAAKKQINTNKLSLKELELTIVKLKSASQAFATRIADLRTEHDWIDKDKEFFGRAGSRYDFAANDPKESQQRLQKLQSKRNELSKNVNMRAMTMLDKTEEQYNDLIVKKRIVENDKVTIAAVIKELDEKKKEALQSAWVKVNQDFGSIFSTLLPGTRAKLVPVDGKTVLDGLEVKVAFGDKWKESLNELSGGQRSLVALSLILALLLFKPAPIYILDEVDAALDLSHTQNIGNMLKSHFKHSQFIVVSLKDGMFNNANVLYKTKFVDGMSAVTRHTQAQK